MASSSNCLPPKLSAEPSHHRKESFAVAQSPNPQLSIRRKPPLSLSLSTTILNPTSPQPHPQLSPSLPHALTSRLPAHPSPAARSDIPSPSASAPSSPATGSPSARSAPARCPPPSSSAPARGARSRCRTGRCRASGRCPSLWSWRRRRSWRGGGGWLRGEGARRMPVWGVGAWGFGGG